MTHSKVCILALLLLGGTSLVLAQPKSGESKPAASGEPKEGARKGMHEGQEGHEGMHEGHEGMHGGHEGHECPMDASGALATWKVERTSDGVVIRLTAKNAGDVPKIQKMAEEMASHMSEHKDMAPRKGEAAQEEGPHKAAGPHKDKPAPAKNPASGTKP